MSRTAYHRAYYYANVERRRASARAARRKAREIRAVVKIVCEAITEARNDKPPGGGGLTRPGGWPYAEFCRFSAERSLTDCSSHVNHPTAPNYSGLLVGATTRSKSLNLHRGGQPVGARRQSGSANGTQGDEP